CNILLYILTFFFSSRRRHTRFSRDWSSDVCSSDLVGSFFLVNVGTLFFGVTFTQRDRVHAFGRPIVYRMILLAAVANVALAASLGTPLRYVGVSFLSIVLAETADTEVFHRLRGRRWLRRVATSNAISAPIDTVVFTLLAFVGEEFATAGWLTQVIVTDVLVKY